MHKYTQITNVSREKKDRFAEEEGFSKNRRHFFLAKAPRGGELLILNPQGKI